ncbi:MAG: 2-phosphosulfolactate phosphatase [Gemmatimonadota bacterium]
MDIQVYFSAVEAESAQVGQGTAVVIDVVRATSVMVEALANGARAIYPTQATEDAIRLATSMGREDTLLCGERRGLKVEGFDLGNSPGEFTPARVKGKRLVMTTTNGTRALLAANGAHRIVVAAFLNLAAVARAVAEDDGPLAVVCAGKEGHFALDDAVCAGQFIQEVKALRSSKVSLGDGAMAALALAESQPVSGEFLGRTAAGKALQEVGLDGDLPYCARRDLHDLVPEMHDRVIALPGG